jgi:hypothetical protein
MRPARLPATFSAPVAVSVLLGSLPAEPSILDCPKSDLPAGRRQHFAEVGKDWGLSMD